MSINLLPLHDVREYAEGYIAALRMVNDRLVVTALNEGGHNRTDVDLADLLSWVFDALHIPYDGELVANDLQKLLESEHNAGQAE